MPFHHRGQGIVLPLCVGGAHKGALALPVLQQSHGHQFLDGLPHRGPAHPQGLGQLPLRHDLVSGLQLAPEDQVPDLLKGLVRDPPGLNGFQLNDHGLPMPKFCPGDYFSLDKYISAFLIYCQVVRPIYN